MAELDRLIKSLYFSAGEDDWQNFRPRALKELCITLDALGATWHTRSSNTLPGEFTEYPEASGLTRHDLISMDFPGKRELLLNPLPQRLHPKTTGAETGYILRYAHRSGGELISTVLLRFAKGKLSNADETYRAVGHMVEASTLALNNFIMRDDWLHSLGRNNRGAAALIDDQGAIYVASKRFRDLLTQEFGEQDHHSLPCPPPAEALAENGGFAFGTVHFRLSKQGPLNMVYARKSVALDDLSPREQQIARALANGKTFKTVARQYTIAISTVANHASRIYKKLGIFRREELVNLMQHPEKSIPTKQK
jgi:DNA-binding CsgD family transcriptional regulator